MIACAEWLGRTSATCTRGEACICKREERFKVRALIYDIEIKKCIQGRHEPKRHEGMEYCDGWHDHANMGISVIGAYDYVEDRTRVFCDDNMGDFLDLCDDRDVLVGFNSIAFDNAVIAATIGIPAFPEAKCYDLLRELWAAAGLPPEFEGKTHGGFGLDATCEKNFGTRKSGNGELAPVLWQQGKIGKVVDYCLNDIRLTKQVFDRVLGLGSLRHPKTGEELKMRMPA